MNESITFMTRSLSSGALQTLGASANALISLQSHSDNLQLATPTATALEMLCVSAVFNPANTSHSEQDIPSLLTLSRPIHRIASMESIGKLRRSHKSCVSLSNLIVVGDMDTPGFVSLSTPYDNSKQSSKQSKHKAITSGETSSEANTGERTGDCTGDFTEDSNNSIESKKKLRRHSRKSIIRQTSRHSSIMRSAQIPKWVSITISKKNDRMKVQKEWEDQLMPLTDLAMHMSKNLDDAIARGVFNSDIKKDLKKCGDMETISTASLTTLHSSDITPMSKRKSMPQLDIMI